MNILSVISSTKLKEINIKGFNGFFTLINLYYSTNLTIDGARARPTLYSRALDGDSVNQIKIST